MTVRIALLLPASLRPLHSACGWCVPFLQVAFPFPFPSEPFNNESHLVMLCSSHLLCLTALLSLKVLQRPGSFLFSFPNLVIEFYDILILIRQPTALPKLVEQMAIKCQMAFWIPLDVESALIQRAFASKMTFSSCSTSASAGRTPSTPLTVEHITSSLPKRFSCFPNLRQRRSARDSKHRRQVLANLNKIELQCSFAVDKTHH
jgi:hypothetical protein